MAQPAEPTRRKLTPEEEAALLAQQAVPATAPATYQTDASTSGGAYSTQPVPATVPPAYAPVELGMYAEPAPAATAPTYQTDASTSFGNYSSAPPAAAAPITWESRPTLDFLMEGEKDPHYVEGGVVYQPPSPSIRQGRGPIQSFPSNPPPPPTQGAGPIESFPDQRASAPIQSFPDTRERKLPTWSDQELSAQNRYIGSNNPRYAVPPGGDMTSQGPSELAYPFAPTRHGLDRMDAVRQDLGFARFDPIQSFPDQNTYYSTTGPVSPPLLTPAQQSVRAEDAQRAAILPSNRSSGIWPTVVGGGNFPTLRSEKAVADVYERSLLSTRRRRPLRGQGGTTY